MRKNTVAAEPLSPTTDDGVPILRLTGEQIGSIEPPLSGDWFTDWDEYEEFVPLRAYDAARRASDAQVAATEQAFLDFVRDHIDDDAFLCDFAGQRSLNIPALDKVVALAATPAPQPAPPLDVEVMMAAIFESERPGDWPTWQDYLAAFGSAGIPPWRRKAERLLAEYERLGAK